MKKIKNIKPTKFLKLPFEFDEQLLVSDLQSIHKNHWFPHYNTSGYEGSWTSIALLAQGGDPAKIHALSSDNALITETPILEHSPYFRDVLDQFKCQLVSARLLNLAAGASIKPHTDYNLGYEDSSFRLHIPITTNKDVNFSLDGESLTMRPGECWYTNVNYVHSVVNDGESDRIHLVIDGERNAWTDKLFFSMASKESFFPEVKESYSLETLARIIKELKLSDLPASRQLLTKLQTELETRKKTKE